MSFSLAYLVQRFFYRIYEFIYHWYVGGFVWFIRHTFDLLEVMDRFFALRITLRYWLKPLYQDYSVIGYILGFILRTGRLLLGGAVYLLLIIIVLLLYIVWAAIPIYIVYQGIMNR